MPLCITSMACLAKLSNLLVQLQREDLVQCYDFLRLLFDHVRCGRGEVVGVAHFRQRLLDPTPDHLVESKSCESSPLSSQNYNDTEEEKVASAPITFQANESLLSDSFFNTVVGVSSSSSSQPLISPARKNKSIPTHVAQRLQDEEEDDDKKLKKKKKVKQIAPSSSTSTTMPGSKKEIDDIFNQFNL